MTQDAMVQRLSEFANYVLAHPTEAWNIPDLGEVESAEMIGTTMKIWVRVDDGLAKLFEVDFHLNSQVVTHAVIH